MQTPLQIEGTWEQIATLGRSLIGRRVRLTVLSDEEDATEEPGLAVSDASSESLQGVWDFIQSLPPSKLTAEDWERIEREFKAERDTWEDEATLG